MALDLFRLHPPFAVPGAVPGAVLGGALVAALAAGAWPVSGPTAQGGAPDYARDVRPVLARHCFRCHGPDEAKAELRLDELDPDFVRGEHAERWKAVLDMLQAGEMPPFTEEQPTDDERRAIVAFVRAGLAEAASAADAEEGERGAVLRRLNKAQVRNTLRELLGVEMDFARELPGDGKSEMGFSNDGEVLLTSPLHVDLFRRIAREALAAAIGPAERPQVTRYRVVFGRDVGVGRAAGETGGYQAVPLPTDDFAVDVLGADGTPLVGSSEPERDALDALRRTISVGLRGSSMDRFRVVDEGLMLYGARPHVEKPPGAWQGPSPNAKLLMQRSFPRGGDFVLRVRASRGYLFRERDEVLIELEDAEPYVALDGPIDGPIDAEGLALRDGARRFRARDGDHVLNLVERDGRLVPEKTDQDASVHFRFELPRDGFYQIDMVHPFAPVERMPSTRLTIDRSTLDRRFALAPQPPGGDADTRRVSTLGAAYLQRGEHELVLGGPFFIGFSDVVMTPLPDGHPAQPRLASELAPTDARDPRVPVLRAFAGTRLDDGMDYAEFGDAIEVDAPFGAPRTYELRGRLEDLPIPEPESGDTEILSGIMVLGIWNESLVKRADDPGPPLLVESLEFEAPYLSEWPPASYRAIFFDAERPRGPGDEAAYTREVVERFLERAFRRPLEPGEADPYVALWHELRPDAARYEDSVADVLAAALCSPSFLFLAEPERADGTLAPASLASRLSYFLWNSPPDEELSALAASGALNAELELEIDRLLDDPRALRFVRGFATEWLRLDRAASVDVNVDVYPDFTRFVKRDMVEETIGFVHHAILEDLGALALIDSDFAMLNQNLAEFYGVADAIGVLGPRFRPVPVTPDQHRGGLLSQGAFLSGHSDGTQAHAIKRAVWVKEKILGDPPPPPPPNVPRLDGDAPGFAGLTLTEQLELHRDNPSCVDCHRSIDPFGVAFERYDATGRRHVARPDGEPIDATTTLPDGTIVEGVDGAEGLKRYLIEHRSEAFVASLIRHLFAYALGREVRLADEPELAALRERVRAGGDTMRAVIRAIATGPSFTSP